MKHSQIPAVLAISAALFSATACNGSQCKVNGTVSGFDDIGNAVILVREGREILDTLTIQDGAFSYACAIDPAKLYLLTLEDPNQNGLLGYARFISDSKAVNVSLAENSEISGSPLTDLLTKVNEDAEAAYGDSEDEDAYYAVLKDAYKANASNAVGTELFSSLAYELPLEEFDEYLAMGNDAVKNNPQYLKLRESKVAESKTGPGKMFVDFSGKTPEGKDVRLSDFVGKGRYTLVDFWASWCGPCMRSMPGMKNLWDTYHAKGLDILGVAVWDGDNSRSRERMVEKDMCWPQIFVGEDKTPTDIYGITGIPHVILFDPEGKVVERGIPNETELFSTIGELLAK